MHGQKKMENSEFWWNLKIEKLGPENQFAKRFRYQIPSGPCAARNIYDFGGATYVFHSWWLCMRLVYENLVVNLNFDTWMSAYRILISIIWLVETVQSSLSNIVICSGVKFEKSWLVTFWWSRYGFLIIAQAFKIGTSCGSIQHYSKLRRIGW